KVGIAPGLVVLHADHQAATRQDDLGGEGACLILPLVEDLLVAHPDPHAVVAADVEAVPAAIETDRAQEAGAEAVGREAVAGAVAAPVVVEGPGPFVQAERRREAEVLVEP